MGSGQWIAAQVKANQEFFVSAALRARGYETFVPSYMSVRQWSDRRKQFQRALISGYVFVRILEQAQFLVVSTPGVRRLIGFGGQAIPIDDSEIERIRRIASSALKTAPWSYIKQDSPVRVTRGSLAGISGTVLQAKENTLLVISIEILQRSVAVHIDRSWVEPA